MSRLDFTNNNNAGTGRNMGIPGNMGMPMQQQDKISGDDLLINYNDIFQTAGCCMFREESVQQIISCLISKNKPNAIMIGPAGCGKTKIVEDIAYRLASDDILIPNALKGYTIYELPLSSIVIGSSLVGDIEMKIQAVIDFCSDPANKAILFIDEIHQLLTGGRIYDNIAQILKPSLARGDLRVIGATTLQEANNLQNDPAFNRRFSRIIIDELTREQTVEILKKAAGGFFSHYKKITVTDAVLEACAMIADNFGSAGSHRPDNALTLLDRAMGDAVVNFHVKIEQAKNSGDANLLQMLQMTPYIPLTENQLTKTAKRLATGTTKKDSLDLTAMKEELVHIKGQEDILSTITDILRRRDMNLFPKTKPETMLFIGPSGVGKTEITKIIAKYISNQKPIIMNMTEYSSPDTINRILGSPAGYIGSDSNQELPFDSLESNPYQIILLDEFEKAHPAVQRLFMQILDEASLTSNHGKTYDFSKTVIIATTNAGYQKLKNHIGFSDDKANSKASVTDLSQWFDPALLNRFRHQIIFNQISENIYREILEDIYATERTRIQKEHSSISLPDSIPEEELKNIIQRTYEPAFGARPARDAVTTYIEDTVSAMP